jgi:hypothetical protein
MRENLIDAYIDANIDDMDTQTLRQIVAETMYDTLQDYTDADLYAEIEEYYPHLLEN